MTKRKTFGTRAVAFMSALLFAMTLLLLFPLGTFRVNAETVYVDALTEGMSISGTIKLNDKVLAAGDEVQNGDNLALDVTWTLPDFTEIENRVFVYDLSDKLHGITLSDITISVDKAKYVVSGNKLYITVLTDYQQDISGYCGLKGTVNVDALDEDNQYDLQFIDTVVPVFVTDLIPKLNISKTAGTVTYDGGKYYQEFTVSVYSERQPAHNVTVTDIGDNGLDFSKIKNLTVKYGDGTDVVCTPSTSGSGFSVTLPSVGMNWNDKVDIKYSVPVDVDGILDGTAGKNNTVTASADKLDTVSATASATASKPSISKSGEYKNGKITWTITVNTGSYNLLDPEFTVTDIPGLNLDSADVATALGGDLVLNKADFTPNGNGNYTYTYQTTPDAASQLTDTTYTNSATAKFTGITGTPEYTSNEASVTVYKTYTEFVDKTYGTVDGDRKLPWYINVEMPDALATEVTVDDYFMGRDDKLMSYDRFKVNGTYTLAANETAYNSSKKPTDIGYFIWEGRKFTIIDSTFLNSVYTNDEDITISYDVTVPSDTTQLTNYVSVDVKVGEQTYYDNDTEIYNCDIAQKYTTTTKEFPAASNYEFPVVWGIRVLTSEPLKVGDKITVVDTLPIGFEYVSCRVGAWNDEGYSEIPQDCITTSVTGSKATGYTVTFVLTVTQELINEDAASTWDACPARIVYLTHADNEHDNLYLNGEQTYTNKATVKKGESNIGEVSCDVTLTPKDTNVVTKDCTTTPASGDESAYATYTININLNEDNLSPGDTLTATDTLGSRLVLDESSIKITPSAPYKVNGQVITFTLNDETYYEITYKASFVAISTEDPYTEEEEKAMFGNSISVGDGGSTSFSTNTIVGEYEVYGGVTSEQALASITISGTKSWSDALNKGARPKEIVITITKHSTFADSSTKKDELTFKVNSDTIDANGNWSYEIKDLPTLTNKGTKITYDVKEVTIDGYKDVKYSSTTTGLTNDTASVTHKLDITNTFTAADNEIGDLTVTKKWVGDSASVRPAIKIVLTDDSADTADIAKELTGTSVTFEDLQLYNYSRDTANNLVRTPRKYKLSEIVVNAADQSKLESYVLTKSYTGEWFTLVDDDTVRAPITAAATLTNTYGEAVSVSVEKVWADNDNQDGIRPTEITVNLLADGVKVDSVVLNSGNSWKYTFTGLAKFKDGKDIVYTVSEEAVANYTTAITGSAAAGFVITNTHTPEKTAVSVEKVWDDNDNQDGIRPTEVTVNLLADGEKVNSVVLNSGNSWKYTFADLDKCKGGKDVVYTVSEDTVTDYIPSITGTAATGFVVTNKHNPDKTAVSVEKVWADNDNQDGIRPTEITVNLLADGTKINSVVLNKDNDWKHTFTALDKFKDGKAIIYTVSEEAVTKYTAAITGSAAAGFVVTNTHTPEKTAVSVEKVWADNNNQDGIRPTEITVNLLADGVKADSVILNSGNSWKYTFDNLDKYDGGAEIKYSVEEAVVPDDYTSATTGSAAAGFVVTNTHTPEKTDISVKKVWDDDSNRDGVRPVSITIKLLADGKTVETITLDEASKWKHTFTGLDKFKDGKEIKYTVEENAVTSYATAITGDAASGFVVTNTHASAITSVTGEKTWVDDNNAAGKRPDSIKITLFGNGVAVAEKEVTEADGWKYTFDNLLMYENGKPITYKVAENPIFEYTPTYSDSNYDITNTYTPGKIFINVTKVWDDGNNRDNLRPTEITVNLLANGAVIKTETLNASNNWTYFAGLDKYDSEGNEIKYTVAEVDVPDGYTSVISGGVTTGFIVTNTHSPAVTTVAVEKKWVDNDNQDGLRPNEVTVNLLADGFDTGISAVLNEGNGWKYTFTGLDKKNGGKDIVYTIEEVNVPNGYTSAITGNAENGFVVTNTHTSEVTSVSGEKFWKDNNNAEGKRPDTITVKLLADGKEVQTMTVRAADNWKYTFANLPKNNNGTEIVYTVDEVAVDGYTKAINGYNITNTYEESSTPSVDEKISITVTKRWNDDNNSAGVRPADLEITLYQNGAVYATMKSDWVKNGNTWTYTFDNLPKYLPGTTTEYTYDIAEENLTRLNYTGMVARAGYNFILTNTRPRPVTIIRPDPNPIPPEDVSSESSITVESDMLDVNNTTSYSLIAILLAVTAGGVVIARRRQK